MTTSSSSAFSLQDKGETISSGRIWAGGVEKDVTFVEVSDPSLNDQIDDAYRAKYHRYAASYVDPMVALEVRTATIKLVPRSTSF